MNLVLLLLENGVCAAVATVGFAALSRPTRQIVIVAAVLAALGRMCRTGLMQAHVAIAPATLVAAMLIALCSMPAARRYRIPAEMFAFPALLPMVPGMFAYQAILKTLQFMEVGNTPQGHTLLGDIVYNGLATFFILCALAIGSTVPLLIFHPESALGRLLPRFCSRRQAVRVQTAGLQDKELPDDTAGPR